MDNIGCMSVINVHTNMNEIQSILPCLPYDDVTIGVFLKWCLEYISPYMLGNVCPNMVMIVLWNLIEKSYYINIWILPFIING
jgi:hypothetical protein